MLIELWFSKLKEHAQRIVREGHICDCDGRKCFLHPELFSHVLPCRCRRDEVEDDASFLARMLAFEEINTLVIRQLLDLDRAVLLRGRETWGAGQLASASFFVFPTGSA